MRRRRDRAKLPTLSVLLEGEAKWADDGIDPSRLEVVPLDGAGDESFIAGLERAEGEVAVLIRAGEELLAGGLRRLAETLSSDPRAVVAYPAFRQLDRQGEVAETVVPEEPDLIELFRQQQIPAGPAPAFRVRVALEAARGAVGEPDQELAFWLGLAARGRLRRVAEPLAQCLPAPTPVPAGLEAARARLAMLERLGTDLALPPGSEQIVTSAARTGCVLAAADVGAGFNAREERICVVDRFGALPDPLDPDLDAEVLGLEAGVADLEREVDRQRAAVNVLESLVQKGVADG